MTRSLWRPVAVISILVLTLSGFIYYFVSHPLVRQQLRSTAAGTLLLLIGLYCLVLLLLSFVTYATLKLCGVRLRTGETILLTMYSSVVNFFGPLQSGPAFRGVYLKRKHKLELKRYTVASLVFYMLYALISGIFLLSTTLTWWLFVGIGLLLAIAWLSRPLLGSFTDRFTALHLRAVPLLALATFLQLSVMAVIYFVELRSVDSSVHFGQAIVYAGAANFSLFVSLTPGGIGFRESFLLFSQHLHHVPSSTIVAANIIDRSIYIVLLAIIGLVILASHSKRKLQPDT